MTSWLIVKKALNRHINNLEALGQDLLFVFLQVSNEYGARRSNVRFKSRVMLHLTDVAVQWGRPNRVATAWARVGEAVE